MKLKVLFFCVSYLLIIFTADAEIIKMGRWIGYDSYLTGRDVITVTLDDSDSSIEIALEQNEVTFIGKGICTPDTKVELFFGRWQGRLNCEVNFTEREEIYSLHGFIGARGCITLKYQSDDIWAGRHFCKFN